MWRKILAITVSMVMAAIPAQAEDAAEAFMRQALPPCETAVASDAGCQMTPDFDAGGAAARLGDMPIVYWIDGEILRIAARADAAPKLCCTFQNRMSAIGNGAKGPLWGLQFHLPHMAETHFEIRLPGSSAATLTYRGPRAPELSRAATLKGSLEEVEIDSANLGGKRMITIYRPAGLAPKGGFPVIYAADGSAQWMASYLEPLIDKGLVQPMLLIGIDNGQDRRSAEYLLGWKDGEDTYRRHETFVLTEVMPLAEQRYDAATDRQKRMVYGYSSGGAWALGFGAAHSDLFGHVDALAVAGSVNAAYAFASARDTIFYIGAGAYDPFKLQSRTFCRKVRQAEADCRYLETYAGHDSNMWIYGFIEAVKAAFPG